MIDDDEYDDDYGDWYDDYEEPTEAQKLDLYVEADAWNPVSSELMDRQQHRWDDFYERQAREAERAFKEMDTAQRPKKYGGPVWWELWVLPSEDGTPLTPQKRQGDINLNIERKCEDVYGAGRALLTTLITSERTYMDFYPALDHGIPNPALFRNMADENGVVRVSDMVGDWGWWDGDQSRFRQIVYATTDPTPNHPRCKFAALMKAPPPYGVWVPSLDLDPVRAEN